MVRRALFVSFWMVTASPAWASREDGVIRWSDVVARVDEHPRIRESLDRSRAAVEAVRAAGQVPNPRLEVSGGTARSRDRAQSAEEWALSVSVPMEWLGTRGARVDAARASANAAREDGSALRREVVLQLRRLFLTLAYDQQLVASHTATLSQAEELARLVVRRVEKGEGRPTEVPRVEIEAERARAALELATTRRDVHREQLSLWLGRRVSRVEGDIAATPEPPSPAPTSPAESHPSVLAAQARLSAARADVTIERRQRIPMVTVTGYVLTEIDRDAAGGGLGTELPVWNWNSGRIAQAEAHQAAEANRVLAATTDVRASLVEAEAGCRQSGSLARRYREFILPRAEKSARTLERSFQLGETTLIEVLESRRVLLESRRDALAAALEQQLECSALVLLSGGDLS